jgi:probable F420-dependent oxidoreductase
MPDLRWGLTVPFPGVPLHDHEELFRRAEAAGWHDLWSEETAGADGFAPLMLAAAWTERLRLVTGIVNAFTRGPAVMAQHCAALQDASNGRFVLGLGSSSNVIVERWNEIPFEKPLSRVRHMVEALRPVLAGERGPGGFKLAAPPETPPPIILAALRGKMLALAAEAADGAFTNFLPISGAKQVVETFGRPDKELACRFFLVPQPRDEAIGTAKFMFTSYATVPVYTEFFRWLGWAERIDPVVEAWQAGDRKRAVELVPEELVDEIFVFGTPDEQRDRLMQYADAGITTLVLTFFAGPDELPGLIDALAPR